MVGSYKPDDVRHILEEDFTVEQYAEIEGFLTYLSDHNLTIGHSNFETQYGKYIRFAYDQFLNENGFTEMFILNGSGVYLRVAGPKLDRSDMKECQFFDSENDLYSAALKKNGLPIDEIIGNEIEIEMFDQKWHQTHLNGISYELEEQGTIESYISNLTS